MTSVQLRMKGLSMLLILMLALTAGTAWLVPIAHATDETVTPEEARRAALAWLHVCPDFATNSIPKADGLDAYVPAQGILAIKDSEQRQTIAYVLKLEPTGFIVVTPRFRLQPIIAYSANSSFDATESTGNVLLALLRSDLSQRLQALDNGAIAPAYQAGAMSRWAGYLDMVDPEERVQASDARAWLEWDVDHGPFLTSVWGQSTDGLARPTFNYYTPNNYVCGCVATALGQVLNYYRWPLTGTWSHSYSWNSQTLSADFGSTSYDWANILDDYTGSTSTLQQRQAAGRLTYHAGVAVDMEYTASGSGAVTAKVADALKHYFRATGEWAAGTDGDFYERLYANMLNHRPAELAIRDTVAPYTGGHAVVVDGVQHNSGDQAVWYHMNMGWEGYTNGWYYDIASGFTTSSYTWDTITGAVLDIVPTPDLVDPGTSIADARFPVSWHSSHRQAATQFELQQARIGATPGTISEDAESGTGEWTIRGNWQASTRAHSGSQSLRGYFSAGSKIGTLLWDRLLMIRPSTSISYWWQTNYLYPTGGNAQARLEISTDGTHWSVLRTHTDANSSAWALETVSAAELAAYAGTLAQIRFVVEHLSDSYYSGEAYDFVGFFVDDIAVNDVYASEGWTSLAGTQVSESQAVTVSQDGAYGYRVRASGCAPSALPCSAEWFDWSDIESVTVTGLHNSAANGNWHTGSTWTSGTIPGSNNSAIINTEHAVIVDNNAQCYDLLISNGSQLVIPYGLTLTVADELSNNGTLQQTRDVNGNADIPFLDAGGYGGLTLNANDPGDHSTDLGKTTVTIDGNQDCTAGPSGSSVRRCFNIIAQYAAGRNASIRFYFSANELGTIACNDVQAWHWTGSQWEVAGPVTGRQCTTEPYYVEVTGISSLSPFVLDNDQPAIPIPTAVDMSRFEAGWAGSAIQIEWATTSEIDNLGFHLYRSTSVDGPAERLNESLIPSQVPPGSPTGATYMWLDERLETGRDYYYTLEDVDSSGLSNRHGPVHVAGLSFTPETAVQIRRIHR